MSGKIEGEFEIFVDKDLCQGHGVCEGEAPEVFEVVDNKFGYSRVRVLDTNPDESQHDAILNAVKYCPNKVLRIKKK